MRKTCRQCNKPVAFEGCARCENCYEVERRLEEYLSHPRGLEFVCNLLKTQEIQRNLEAFERGDFKPLSQVIEDLRIKIKEAEHG
jgi:hypothetical protein